MIARDHAYAQVVQATVDKYAATALTAITPAQEQLQNILSMGEDPWVTPRFAQDSLRKKLKVVGLSMPLPEVPPPPPAHP
jgi:ribonucleoside-diphosphate reductase beta chain